MKRFRVAPLCAVLAGRLLAVDAAMLKQLEWRSIGPAVMGGRISALAGDGKTLYVAAASGGLFRTDNGGTTFTPLFDRQSTLSMGAVAVEPGNARVVWVGTGESKLRNSVSFGDGVYKSTDGGATWRHLGLENTRTISGIVIDPADPRRVVVAAVGHPFGPSEERGVFVTQDGGATWRKTLYADDRHGAVGLEMDPHNSGVLYAGLWRFDRKPWTYTSGSEQGGVFKSQDGGLSWRKLGAGLPKLLGRVSVRVAPGNSQIVWLLAESNEGTLFRSRDGGEHFEKISDDRELVGRAYYFTDMRVGADSENHLLVLADALLESRDGGQSFQRASPSVHGDVHALWMDGGDGRHWWQGNDGGLAETRDAGAHWEQVNNLALGQLYHVSADERKPFYQVTVGMQDDGLWTGPSRTREPAGIFNDDWRMIHGFSGFHSLAEADQPDVILSETAGGALYRTDMRTRAQQAVGPQARNYAGAPAREMKYRFNWDAPLERSPHGKKTIYLAGNVVFQSSDEGRTWETISRDLTTAEATKLGNIGGPIALDNSAAEVYSTITALAESPAKRNVIWAGTDDGNLQLTENGGGDWVNVAAHLPGVAAHSPVSHVEPSKTSAGTAYVSLDRHMFDDLRPYIFKTTDSGKTWANISGNLPAKAFVWIVREDPREPRLLYAGTELGLYASFTGGGEWVPLHLKNMPWAVAVRDIVLAAEANDLLVATHGRGLWILDDAGPLQKLAAGAEEGLLAVRPALRYAARATRYGFGDKTYVGANPPAGALLDFFLNQEGTAQLEILGKEGIIRHWAVNAQVGLNRVVWDLRYEAAERLRGPKAVPGMYRVRLAVGGKTYEQPLGVELDPELRVSSADLELQFQTSRQVAEMQAGVKKLGGAFERPRALRTASGPRLKENLDSLFNMLDSAEAAPTGAQLKYFEELKAEYEDAARPAAGRR